MTWAPIAMRLRAWVGATWSSQQLAFPLFGGGDLRTLATGPQCGQIAPINRSYVDTKEQYPLAIMQANHIQKKRTCSKRQIGRVADEDL